MDLSQGSTETGMLPHPYFNEELWKKYASDLPKREYIKFFCTKCQESTKHAARFTTIYCQIIHCVICQTTYMETDLKVLKLCRGLLNYINDEHCSPHELSEFNRISGFVYKDEPGPQKEMADPHNKVKCKGHC